VYYVHIIRFSDPLSFRARAAAFLLPDEVENNLLLSIAATTPLPADGYLAIVEDGDSIVACAVRTPPRRRRAASGSRSCTRHRSIAGVDTQPRA